MYLVLLALFATACGGSDGETAAETDDDAVAEATDSSDDGAAVEAEDDEPEAPAPEANEPLQERDCAHTSAELAGDDAPAEVVLPPAVKPDVADEFLVPVNELITTDLIEGTGEVATAGMSVQMQYVGVLASDGSEFDASWNRGQSFDFILGSGQVIAGWDEGIEGMQVGGRRVLQIPSAKAYGEQGPPGIGANADLVFVVDLIAVGGGGEPAPPIDDASLGSFADLQIEDLVVGEGCEARRGDIVKVNYVGVNGDDGVEFDSSWGRGEPLEIIVGRSQVIDGWNAGIAGMNVGGERILQIPASQAYGDGDLVFRVHLEELIEAPLAHTIEFEGDSPDDAETTTIVEGTGAEVGSNDIIDVNLAVMLWDSNVILQSTWQQDAPTQIALSGGALIPGLAEGIVGTRIGELRQIVLPTSVAYPDGLPQGAGFEEGDALVFIVEPIRIN